MYLRYMMRTRPSAKPICGTEMVRIPPHFMTDMIVMREDDAAATVYASTPDDGGPEPVGTTCRVCPRDACAHRVADPLTG